MGSLTSYEGICEVLDSLPSQNPSEAIAILDELENLLKSKIRSRNLKLNAAEKEALQTVTIPDLRKQINSLLVDDSKSTKAKSKNKKATQSSNEESISEYLYSFEEDEGDLDSVIEQCEDWSDLNPDQLPYANWLHEIGLREFFCFSDEVIYKIAACVCLTHSAAIPGKVKGIITQPQLLKVLAYSLKAGTGKSTFCDWVGNHYATSEDPDHAPFQTVMDNDSLKGLRDVLDRACHINDGVLREAAIHLDDFEPRHIASGGIWAKSRGLFINVVRNQSISRVSINGSSDKREIQDVFYCWALMMMSSNHHPKELFSVLPKMERRCIILPFEEMGSRSLGSYDWSSVHGEYKALWNKSDIEKIFWKGILRPLLRKSFSDFKYLSKENIVRSLVLMAVGIFSGIFADEEDAEKHLNDYWDYTEERLNIGHIDLFLNALASVVDEHEKQGQTLVSKLSRSCKYIEISQDQILEKIGNVSALTAKEKEQRMISYLTSQGYELSQRMNTAKQMKNIFVKRF